MNRKVIEEYYKNEWKEIVSPKTLSFLIELTCRTYQLNKPSIPGFIKENEPLKPQDLGKI